MIEYQFCVDGKPAAPRRHDKLSAYQDAIELGFATWVEENAIRLDEQGEINQIETTPL